MDEISTLLTLENSANHLRGLLKIIVVRAVFQNSSHKHGTHHSLPALHVEERAAYCDLQIRCWDSTCKLPFLLYIVMNGRVERREGEEECSRKKYGVERNDGRMSRTSGIAKSH
ncbi:hypothetical protein E2C01_051705 [Portunus trituberculatus]|uniref:Uncharacterized protein n=1 Tax=Portunus trituberculatus TaxID=210409 RepID=A0A5B7GL70_PORTR|nr:hypothetical protein [Portunus trituberculatus]